MSYPPYGDGNQGGFQPPPPAQPSYGDGGQGGFQPPPPQPNPFGQPQPQSAPPAPGQPFSSPPAAQPYSSPPGYGPEPAPSFSGPGFGNDPYAPGLPPASGPGYPGGPTPPGQPKNKMVPIFASLTVLFLLLAAVFGVLFVTKNGDYNDTKKAAQTKEQQLSGDLKKTQDDLKKAQDELASTKRDLGGAQDQADELKRQKQVISNCIKLLVEAGEASRAGNAALAQQKQTEAAPVCNEADRYLD
jgi:F0F1-type ATP synthase membrane subunit b/b'